MSDSAKLHFIYGILYLIIAFIFFSIIVIIVVLAIAKTIEPFFAALSFIFLLFFANFILASINEFIKVGQLTQK